ncbi:enhancer of polycomb [Nesidiocoris tenuis]|uniref:Enhancer of polycomb-like protein n=1 Tax=Nesidiocoris tenuis TaxID=355587 RepID=A0ABN7B3K6_9HEMI|nr:enhancer of polycomb [Nesidiocoris tenuis]
MSKLFRAKALDASKHLPIYRSEELPDLPEYSAINRAVPQMPSGMNKEEESEHHLQRAIVTGLIIPTPEVDVVPPNEDYDRMVPANYKPPRQLIHMQPFMMEEDVPDYDMDSEDEKWLSQQKLDITPLKFEEMMDQLEKNCAQNIASQNRKDLLLKEDDELSIAIYDYWLAKRIKSQPQPLVPTVRTEVNNRGATGNMDNNPYLAFRRRTEKMQTRKHRKNDETSYEKMVKLKRDLTRALQLLEIVKKRESAKKDLVELTVKIFEKRYQANDMSGALLAEVSSYKSQRPAFAPIYTNQFTPNHASWPIKPPKDEVGPSRKEKRQYKKRKHKTAFPHGEKASVGTTTLPSSSLLAGVASSAVSALSSGDDEPSALTLSLAGSTVPSPPSSPKLAFPFHRRADCSYKAPVCIGGGVSSPSNSSSCWPSPEDEWSSEAKCRLRLGTLAMSDGPKFTGYFRRRVGRGGRVLIDRGSVSDFWSSVDFSVFDSRKPPPAPPPPAPSTSTPSQPTPSTTSRIYRPKTPPSSPIKSESSEAALALDGPFTLQIQDLFDCETTALDVEPEELFPDLDLTSMRSEGDESKRKRSRSNLPFSDLLTDYEEATSSTYVAYDDDDEFRWKWNSQPSNAVGVSSSSSSSVNLNASGSSRSYAMSSYSRETSDVGSQFCSSLPSSSSSIASCSTGLQQNHRLPPPPSDNVLVDRAMMANGPINHSDHGGRGQLQSSGNPMVPKWNANGSDVNSQTGSGQMPNSFSSKLQARANSATQHNSSTDGVIAGDNVHKRPPTTGTTSQGPLVHSAPPMEVT